MFFAMFFATLAGFVCAAILLRVRGPICLQVGIFRDRLGGEWRLLFGDRVCWWGGGTVYSSIWLLIEEAGVVGFVVFFMGLPCA